MNTHRAIIEHLWPEPSTTLIASGDYEQCLFALGRWIGQNPLKQGDTGHVVRIQFTHNGPATEASYLNEQSRDRGEDEEHG